MGWVKLDDQRAMNRKLRAAGFAARGLDEAAMCQVAADGTDGHITAETVEVLAVAHRCKDWKKLVDTLVAVGRWFPNTELGGWDIHHFLDYNPTKAEWDAEKEKKRAAGRRGGKASAQARGSAHAQAPAQADAQAGASADGEANAQAVPSRPVPGKPPTHTSGNTSSPLGGAGDFSEGFLEAVERLTLERYSRYESTVKMPEPWLAKTRADICATYRHVADRMHPDCTGDEFYEEMQHTSPRDPGLDCEVCGGGGMVELPDGTGARCQLCNQGRRTA